MDDLPLNDLPEPYDILNDPALLSDITRHNQHTSETQEPKHEQRDQAKEENGETRR